MTSLIKSSYLTFTFSLQVSVNDGSLHSDSNVSLEIPAKTALAYSIMELSVKTRGEFGNIFLLSIII